MRVDARSWALAAVIVALAGLLYFLTAARDIVVGDTGELITAAVSLGVAHPPGYPLFTMLGHLFSLLPLGSIPFRVNLLAVVCDALTVGVVYFTALYLTRSRLAGAVAALVLAVNPTFWGWSLAGEVFPLNNLLAALLIYLVVVWHESPERTGFLVACCFVGGLALTNHQTIVLLAPACCLVVWQCRAVILARPTILVWCLIAFLLGLLPYLYVPWASAHHPAYNWGNVSSARDLFDLIRRKSYGSFHLVSTPGYSGGSGFDRVIALTASFGPLFAVAIVPGAIRAYQRRRWYFWFSLIAFVFAGPFFVSITNLNIATAPSALFVLQRFFVLSQVVVAPLVAFGVLFLAGLLARFVPSLKTSALPIVTVIGLTAAALTVKTYYHQVDQSDNTIARRFAEDVFLTAEPDSVLFVTADGFIIPLIYFQTIEGAGRGVILIPIALLSGDWYVQQLRKQHPDLVVPFDNSKDANLKWLVEANPKRKFYTVGLLEYRDRSLEEGYEPYPHGLLSRVQPKSWFNIERMVNENEPILKRYHFPSPEKVRRGTFERDILELYAQPAVRFAAAYERIGEKTEARTWYERALGIDPYLSTARKGLARVR
jgi:Protein of unknown function (DUF2723)